MATLSLNKVIILPHSQHPKFGTAIFQRNGNSFAEIVSASIEKLFDIERDPAKRNHIDHDYKSSPYADDKLHQEIGIKSDQLLHGLDCSGGALLLEPQHYIPVCVAVVIMILFIIMRPCICLGTEM